METFAAGDETFTLPVDPFADRAGRTAEPLVAVDEVHHAFGSKKALRGVSLEVAGGEIHALLGPNGAGKTTLLRVLSGLVEPRRGSSRVAGVPSTGQTRELRQLIGLVPSGDRTFYLRISGLENLAFFGRMHGLRRRDALRRAKREIEAVGLAEVARKPVYTYSHGMQKRLAVARALIAEPRVLLVDEATHDLDPEGSQRVRELVRASAGRGTAVIWTTQRLEEIRGFADRVTLLSAGRVRFCGSVPELMSLAESRAYVVELDRAALGGELDLSEFRLALWDLATLEAIHGERGPHVRLRLKEGVLLGDALLALAGAGAGIVTCREERSEIEEAFLAVTAEEPSP